MRALLFSSLILLSSITFSQVPVNWNIDEVNPGNDITLVADAEKFTEGSYSCRMQLNSGAVPYLLTDKFEVNPGENYQFSIDVFDNDTVGQLKVYCDFFDAIGNNVFGEQPVLSENSEEWQTIQWTGMVPPDAVQGYVLIKFYCEPNPTTFIDTALAWVDNCLYAEEGGSNLVVNGGFEEWAVGVENHPGVTDAFQLYPNPAVDYVYVNASVNFDLVRISDMSGKIILEKEMTGPRCKLDVAPLPSGIYIVQLFAVQTLKGSMKLIKN